MLYVVGVIVAILIARTLLYRSYLHKRIKEIDIRGRETDSILEMIKEESDKLIEYSISNPDMSEEEHKKIGRKLMNYSMVMLAICHLSVRMSNSGFTPSSFGVYMSGAPSVSGSFSSSILLTFVRMFSPSSYFVGNSLNGLYRVSPFFLSIVVSFKS